MLAGPVDTVWGKHDRCSRTAIEAILLSETSLVCVSDRNTSHLYKSMSPVFIKMPHPSWCPLHFSQF